MARVRPIGMVSLLVVGTLLWTAFGLGLWAKRQVLETDAWVDTSTRLLENEPIRTAVGLYIVDQLYNSQAVEARLKETLPPRLQPLAGPAASGLKEIARRNVPRLLGSAAALEAWKKANRTAHEQLLAIVNGDVKDQPVTIELKDLFTEVAAGTGVPASAVDKIPPNVANLQVATPQQVNDVRKWLDLFKTIVWVLLGTALAAFAGAIALARDRRRAVVNVGGCMIFAGIALLAIRSVAGKALVNALAEAPNAHAIAPDVWGIGTSLLVDVAEGSILFGLFVVLGAWLVGAGRRATATRRFAAHSLREHAGLVRVGLAVLLLLLIIWGPVPWTQKPLTILIFTVLAYAWLEWLRYRTLEEFPDQPPPKLPTLRRRAGTPAVTQPGGTTQ
jgi:hypothetical protein